MMKTPPRHSGQTFSRLTGRAICLVSSLMAAPAAAVTPVVLIDTELNAHQVNLHGLSDGTISFFDVDRELRVEPIARYIQVRVIDGDDPAVPVVQVGPTDAPEPIKQSDPDQPSGVIELTDGQRLTGWWVGTEEPTQQVRWRHPTLGELGLGLDRVTLLSVGTPSPTLVIIRDSDRLELHNGDKMAGLVESVATNGLVFHPDGHAEPVEVPINQVRGLRLANPVDLITAIGVTVWLTDGSRVRAASIDVASDRILIETSLTMGRSVLELPLSAVSRIDMTSTDGYLIGLQDLPTRVTAGGVVFGLDTPPRIKDRTIVLHAPVTVRWLPPAGATRFAGTVELVHEPGPPNQARAWADLEVVVWVGGRQVQRIALNADHRGAVLNTPLDGQVLTIELDPAANGPVMDRVVLRDAVVFIRPRDEVHR